MPTTCSWAAARAPAAHGDGKSGLLYPTSAANTAIEVFEARVPVLVQEKTFLTDTGGAGRARAAGSASACGSASCTMTGCRRWRRCSPKACQGGAAWPARGGQAGGRAFAGVRAPDGTLLRDCGAGRAGHADTARRTCRDRVRRRRRLRRPAAAHARQNVAADLQDGRISADAAREHLRRDAARGSRVGRRQAAELSTTQIAPPAEAGRGGRARPASQRSSSRRR